MMWQYILIGLGGALGSMARFWASEAAAWQFGKTFPWGTLIVNVSGSFLIGALAALSLTERQFALSPSARIFLMVGICGGYTTFSSFSLQTLQLIQQGDWPKAIGNVLLSTFLCLVAVWAGHALCLNLNSVPKS